MIGIEKRKRRLNKNKIKINKKKIEEKKMNEYQYLFKVK